MGLGPQQPAVCGQAGDDIAVGLFHVPAGQPSGFEGEAPVGSNRIEGRQVLGSAEGPVVRAERRGDVDQPGSVVTGDKSAGDDPPTIRPVRDGDEVEGSLVSDADQLGSAKPPGRPSARTDPEDGLRSRLGHHHSVDHQIGEIRVDGHCGVRHQCPRRRGPHEELLGTIRPRPVDREADVGAQILHIAVDVGLTELVARQGGPAAWAEGDNLHVLEHQPAVPQLAKVPPHRLHVVRRQGPVGVGGVDPEADAVGEPLPVTDVGVHRLPAALHELGDAVRLDLVLAGEPQTLFDLDLDGQPVGIPPGPA